MAHIQIRISEKDKNEAKRVFDRLGLDMSSAIKLFLRQAVIHNALPFSLSVDKYLEATSEVAELREGVRRDSPDLQKFIETRKYLFWDVRLEKLNEEAVVERILNYGDWEDVQLMLKIIGIKKVAIIFRKQIEGMRNNYRGSIKNYYNLYFKKYA
jgi:DNA-damage-inducible protein J